MPPAPHLITLHGEWSMWRHLWLRAAGFPARGVLALAVPALAAQADQQRALAAEAAALRARVIVELTACADEGGPLASTARGALAQVERDRLPRPDAALDARIEVLARLRAHEAARARHHADYEAAYQAASEHTSQVLRRLAQAPSLREALLWQNRGAVAHGLDWLAAHPEARNSTSRQKEALVASYLQRYSLKNDTIGFFGPIAWATFSDDDEVEAAPGPRVIGARRVCFEQWAIEAVAARMSAAPDVRPFIAPRLRPGFAVRGTTLLHGVAKVTEVGPAVARLLGACDGDQLAGDIVRALAADPAAALSEPEAWELLEELAERKLVTWTLEPSALTHAERELRRLLERIAAPQVRQRELAKLDRLEAALAAVEAAAGAPVALARALEAIDAVFEEVAGRDATRSAGQTYAGRTVVYEDCVRDLRLTLGRPVIDRLGPVVALLAQSARWFTHEIAARFRAALCEAFAALRRSNPGEIRYVQLLDHVGAGVFEREEGSIARAVDAELSRRWADILGVDLAQRRCELTVADLAPRVAQVFAAAGPGWPGARYVSPDILLAAPSIDALRRGEGTPVIGEVHLGNSLLVRFVHPHTPVPADEMIRWYEADLPDPRVFPMVAELHGNRSANIPWSARDLDLELGAIRSRRDRAHVLRAADLVVEAAGDSLRVRDARSGRSFDVIAVLETQLKLVTTNMFRPAPHGPHVPRITIDGVVLARETWRLGPDELRGLGEGRGPRQFEAVRAWASRLGIPRWVFAKVPEEPKPVFVDLMSPIYVEMFAKLVRTATRLTISEMVPSIDDTWIPDAAGETYTGELRFAVLDPAPWIDPSAPAA